MEWWQAFILGLVQGLTEFLPVSSSGHLMIFKEIVGADAEGFL
ncbi:MAG: UDP-diphosphatase, partial [Bacteroidales bacterium]|nr:UDP-diphosphatase [Bacteroidales bacterium]